MSFGLIQLTHGKVAIVDSNRVAALRKFHWRAVRAHFSWYAKTTIVRDDHRIDLSMHRFIARTPFGQVCHHQDGNSLNNRDKNLENMSKLAHKLLHANKRILTKRDPAYGYG